MPGPTGNRGKLCPLIRVSVRLIPCLCPLIRSDKALTSQRLSPAHNLARPSQRLSRFDGDLGAPKTDEHRLHGESGRAPAAGGGLQAWGSGSVEGSVGLCLRNQDKAPGCPQHGRREGPGKALVPAEPSALAGRGGERVVSRQNRRAGCGCVAVREHTGDRPADSARPPPLWSHQASGESSAW